VQKRKNRSSSLYFVETIDKTPESEGERENMVTKDEYNQVKYRVRELEKEIKTQMREKFDRAKIMQELEKDMEDYKQKISRLLNENEDFRRNLEQQTNLHNQLKETKAETDRNLKKFEENFHALEKKVDILMPTFLV
jgi:chromosome segregation ATPase